MIKDVFERIYKNNLWDSPESRSGIGSEKRHTTEIINAISYLYENYNIRNICDAGCGDLNWFPEILSKYKDIKYTGIDIVSNLIENHKIKYPEHSFFCSELDSFNYSKYDLIVCRDVLVHLPNEMILKIINMFRQSKTKYLLTTSFIAEYDNSNIPVGNWRPISLSENPFNFKKVKNMFSETYLENGEPIVKYKRTYLYDMEDM